ncbi:sigma-70 family RNA polymerase sigma factor [Paenibacillus glucanolyticus]|jgi:RNA polymerase sigma-70 factor (ECF subfamily)|uniref:RNA polymerase subunit sigma-70 n=1 Tax=Paenibacillus glucanolyticus TaxID=59843 RepID=A0A163GPX1_9BACL|nr:sigma-70 family RNA polymerase sigma factor [Paenibacillus glucanolyticus]KZS45082.1 hypothetical protein AWU65_03630 [Paenibacillus glucanolyticus]OMF65497.1 hypothetical protein BK142_30865 [Paenibacillus glucanolyticus]
MKPNITHEQVLRILSGDQVAFTAFYEENRDMLYYQAYRFLKHREDAEDVVQEAYIRIYLNLHTYNFSCRINTWMKRIVKNLCIDRVRRNKSKPHYSIDEQNSEGSNFILETLSDGEKTPDQQVVDNEESKRVLHLVKTMPDQYKNVFLLRFFSDYSLIEIADNLSMEVNTVKSRIFRGRAYLRRKYRVS